MPISLKDAKPAKPIYLVEGIAMQPITGSAAVRSEEPLMRYKVGSVHIVAHPILPLLS